LEDTGTNEKKTPDHSGSGSCICSRLRQRHITGAGNNGTGFRPKVGADGNNNQGGNSGGTRPHVTATKRWNRTNY